MNPFPVGYPIPSLLSPYPTLLPETGCKMRKESPTAFLDGIRGYAALFVCFYHLRLGYTDEVHASYGTGTGNRSILQFPFIRILFAGQSMIVVFFVVSGYALASGALKDIHAGNIPKSLDRIRSSILRRAIRLFLPTLVASFVACICIYLGFYAIDPSLDVRAGYREPEPAQQLSFFAQLYDWFWQTAKFLNIYIGDRHAYYPNSWSIPVEFSCSLALYMGLVAITKLVPLARIVCFIFYVFYCQWTASYWQWMFYVGASLAQLNQFIQVGLEWKEGRPPSRSSRQTGIRVAVFLTGLFLLSYPEAGANDAPGYRVFASFSPSWPSPNLYWNGIGSALVVWSTSNCQVLQQPFTSRIGRFLGRISFALYLVHGIVIQSIGIKLIPLIWKVTGNNSSWTWELGFFIATAIYVPICLVSAHYFSLFVDEPSLRLTKSFESLVTGSTAGLHLPGISALTNMVHQRIQYVRYGYDALNAV